MKSIVLALAFLAAGRMASAEWSVTSATDPMTDAATITAATLAAEDNGILAIGCEGPAPFVEILSRFVPDSTAEGNVAAVVRVGTDAADGMLLSAVGQDLKRLRPWPGERYFPKETKAEHEARTNVLRPSASREKFAAQTALRKAYEAAGYRAMAARLA